MKPCPYIFLELETSGLNPSRNEVISLSALRISKEDPARFDILIRPAISLSKEAEMLTGLTNHRLSQAQNAAGAIREFESWRKGNNIILCRPEFDLPFLIETYTRADVEFRPELVCPLEKVHVRSMLWKFLFSGRRS